jgi:hypothetical protein
VEETIRFNGQVQQRRCGAIRAARGTVKRMTKSRGEQRLVARRLGTPDGRVSARQARIIDCVGAYVCHGYKARM